LTVSQSAWLEIRRSLGDLYCLSGVSGKSIAKFIAASEIAEAGTKALADDEVVSLGFTSLRDSPGVFKHAAVNHPSDPDCWPLTAVMVAVAVLAGASTTDPRIEVTSSPRPQTPPLPATPAGAEPNGVLRQTAAIEDPCRDKHPS
jgi:hypothetical protein